MRPQGRALPGPCHLHASGRTAHHRAEFPAAQPWGCSPCRLSAYLTPNSMPSCPPPGRLPSSVAMPSCSRLPARCSAVASLAPAWCIASAPRHSGRTSIRRICRQVRPAESRNIADAAREAGAVFGGQNCHRNCHRTGEHEATSGVTVADTESEKAAKNGTV